MPEVIDLLSSTPPHPQDRPPQPSRRPPPAAPSPLRPPPLSLPAPTPTINASSHFILSSDFDTSPIAFTDDVDTNIDAENPSKRRRLSQDSNPGGDGNPKPTSRSPRQSSPFAPPPPHPCHSPPPSDPSRNRLFLFSDEDFLPSLPALSSEGPGPEQDLDIDPSPAPRTIRPILDLPAWNGESDPIVFTSSAPDNGRDRARATETETSTRTMTETVTIDDDDDDDYAATGAGGGHDNRNTPFYRDRRCLGHDDIEPFSDELTIPDLNELLAMTTTTTTTAGLSRDVTYNERGPNLSSRTANLLASLETRSKTEKAKPATMRSGQQGRRGVDEAEEIMDEVAEPRRSGRKKAATSTTKPTSEEKDARARGRETAKAQREQDRQQEKERKQRLKEEKARDKQLAADIAQVNKLKVDKKESTPEMIVDLASSLEGTNVGNQTAEFMSKLGVELTFFTNVMPNVVRWRRKVKARYNDTAGHWEPCAFHIRQEEQVLVLLTAQEFVDMVIASPATQSTASTDPPVAATVTLEQHVQQLKSAYPGCKPIYLIEGLTSWMRKNQNSRNRAYVAEVRRQMEQEMASQQPSSQTPSQAPSQAPSRGRKKAANKPETTPPVDDDTVEDALLQLQVTHSCLIHHSAAAAESAEWIKNFTEHISTVPYRHEMMEGRDAAFCMDTGQVKPGDTKSDTYVKMLQEVHRVTAPMAYGIEVRYPSVVNLVQGMRRGGPALLEDVKKSANKNGALTDSRIGPAASKRLYKVFMGLDPSSTDI